MSNKTRPQASDVTPAPAPVEAVKYFNINDLSEGELTFIVNAIHSVQIEAKDARVVSDLQTRLVKLLTGQ